MVGYLNDGVDYNDGFDFEMDFNECQVFISNILQEVFVASPSYALLIRS